MATRCFTARCASTWRTQRAGTNFPGVTMFSTQEQRRFWARVKRQEGGCWEWQGARFEHGYGAWKLKQKMLKAHRVALQMCRPIPFDGAFALHSCDNPPCVNPKHLRWGTARDNMHDVMVRGRRPSQIEDLVGRRFGKLTVVDLASKRPARWHVLCDCGNAKSVAANGLKTGDTKSCGCNKRESMSVVSRARIAAASIAGKRYGSLIVTGLGSVRGRLTYWTVRCACGATKEVQRSSLTHGRTRSCGARTCRQAGAQ